MATEIVAPDVYPHFDWPRSKADYRLFLAGAIDMGWAVNWQAQVVEMFQGDDFLILNPRRPHFDDSMLDEQIEWELQALEDAVLIFMWFPRDSKAPVALLETGLYWQAGKLILGAEPGFYRRRNLELTAERYPLKLYDNLPAMVRAVRYAFGFQVK